MDAGRFAGLFPSCFWKLTGDSRLQGEKSQIFPNYKYYTKTPRGTQNIWAITACKNVPRKTYLHLYSPQRHKVIGRNRVGGTQRSAKGCRALSPATWERLRGRVRVRALGWLGTAQAAFCPCKSQEPGVPVRRYAMR